MPTPTPRVFIIRHGETEWSLNGRHTGTTDIPLTPAGESRVRATGHALVGADRLITPRNLAHIYVSPRARAQRTLALLLEAGNVDVARAGLEVQTCEDVREWDYGEYEGRTSKDIAGERAEKGLPVWDIWRDGCPGGESPEQITTRLDRVIADIRSRFHAPAINHESTEPCPPCDVLVVAHGHILRAFAARWIGRPVSDNPGFILEAGAVGTLSYEHRRMEEPAILLGGAFVVEGHER